MGSVPVPHARSASGSGQLDRISGRNVLGALYSRNAQTASVRLGKLREFSVKDPGW
jgi:hypothetical protein